MKERIQNAARDIFIKDGYSRLNMDDLARELGISKKTIYEHFDTKKQLFADTVKSIYEAKFEQMRNLMSEMTEDGEFRFIEKLPKLWDMIKGFTNIFTPVLLADIHKYAHELNDYCRFQDDMMKNHMNKVFVIGKNKGYVKEHVNEEVFRMMFMSSMYHIMRPEILAQLPCTMEECMYTIYEILHTGVLSEKGRTDYNKLILLNK